MRSKAIKMDASGAPAPAVCGDELDRGIADVDQGRVTPVSDAISELDRKIRPRSVRVVRNPGVHKLRPPSIIPRMALPRRQDRTKPSSNQLARGLRRAQPPP